MKKIIYLILLVLLVFACQTGNKNHSDHIQEDRILTKLEKLLLLPQNSVLLSYDLSNDSLMTFPDLSGYSIKFLDLSHNLLDTIIVDNLPKELERLNLSYNQYKGDLQIEEKTIPYLKEIDMSHNDLKEIYISEPLYRILLSYNDLIVACFNHKNLCYLDVSYNCNMPSEVCFEPTEIDTVIRDGVVEGERLLGPISVRYYNPIE
jgi:hypothetical protein